MNTEGGKTGSFGTSGGSLLEAELFVLLLHAWQGVSQGLHVAQQHWRHHDPAGSVAGLAAVVLELACSPDALRAYSAVQ